MIVGLICSVTLFQYGMLYGMECYTGNGMVYGMEWYTGNGMLYGMECYTGNGMLYGEWNVIRGMV